MSSDLYYITLLYFLVDYILYYYNFYREAQNCILELYELLKEKTILIQPVVFN